VDTQKEITLQQLQEYSKKQRLLIKSQTIKRSLYDIMVNNIISIASHGYTQYIHPVDRELWRDDEIRFTKWKLKSSGFEIDHRGKPTSWEYFFRKLFGNPYEYLVVKWSWTTVKDKRHFQWD